MLHSAWDGLWTNMESGSDSPMRKIVQRITIIIQAVADWTASHPALTSAIMDASLAVGALAVVLGTLATAFGAVRGVVAGGKFALSLAGIGAAADTAAGGIPAAGEAAAEVAAAGGVAEVAVEGLAATIGLLTWPVVALVALFAAAAIAIIHWWEPVRAFSVVYLRELWMRQHHL